MPRRLRRCAPRRGPAAPTRTPPPPRSSPASGPRRRGPRPSSRSPRSSPNASATTSSASRSARRKNCASWSSGTAGRFCAIPARGTSRTPSRRTEEGTRRRTGARWRVRSSAAPFAASRRPTPSSSAWTLGTSTAHCTSGSRAPSRRWCSSRGGRGAGVNARWESTSRSTARWTSTSCAIPKGSSSGRLNARRWIRKTSRSCEPTRSAPRTRFRSIRVSRRVINRAGRSEWTPGCTLGLCLGTCASP